MLWPNRAPNMSLRCAAVFLLLVAPYTLGDVIEYEGDVFPEDAGFERAGTFDAQRWLEGGWFCHHVDLGVWAPPPYGEADYYNHDLSMFVDYPFFIEWRMKSSAPNSEVDHQNGGALVVLVGGPVTYHFNIARGLVQFYTGYLPNLYFAIQPDSHHTYRLIVDGGEWFELSIDGVLVAAHEPEDVFPTSDALMSFGARYYRAESTNEWDYVRFGRLDNAIPTVSAWGVVVMSLLVLTAATLVFGRHRRISLTSAVT